MATHFQGSPEEVRALNAFIALMRAVDSVKAALGPVRSGEGLTTSQFGVLEALLHLGPLGQCEIAQKLLTSPGNLVVVLDNLQRRGLVRRQRREDDRRAITVHLTDEGRRLIEEVFPAHARAVTACFQALDAGEQESLRVLCRKLGRGQRGTAAACAPGQPNRSSNTTQEGDAR
jgi:MarR family transcriptional regulator, 2-MHQ and catechol-resistance regulon repressor